MNITANTAKSGLFIIVLMLAGCWHCYEAHEVDGAAGRFCVPEAQVVKDASWIPPDRPGAPKTFAFRGCSSGNQKEPSSCIFPEAVRGGVVSPLASSKVHWQDFAADSFYKKVVSDYDSKLETLDDGSLLIISNTQLWGDWYVWRKSKPFSGEDALQLENDDELVAVCREVENVKYSDSQQNRSTVVCDRSIRAQDYAVSYSFESNMRIPQMLGVLDAQVLAVIERWRCQK